MGKRSALLFLSSHCIFVRRGSLSMWVSRENDPTELGQPVVLLLGMIRRKASSSGRLMHTTNFNKLGTCPVLPTSGK